MITYEPCKFVQEAIFKELVVNPDKTEEYRFLIPTLTPVATDTGYIVNKNKLANKDKSKVIVSHNVLNDDTLINIPYDKERFGDIKVDDIFLIVFVGGDPTRIRILGRA